MFKFPTDFEEIPEITTLDILEHLRNYLTKKNKWTERIDLILFYFSRASGKWVSAKTVLRV
jgi:hypothetical protein